MVETGSRERGSVLILICGLVATSLVLAGGLVRLASAATARARAESAADAAALAAAEELAAGRTPAQAARIAGEVALANGARLIACRCQAGGATVEVVLPTSPAFFKSTVKAESRAEIRPRCPG